MPNDDDEFEPQYYTREEALSIAGAEALRNLKNGEASISYVCHAAGFHDYCLCEFLREHDGWVKTVRSLTQEERLPGEEIQDSSIVELARAGNMISAVRLYRTKYRVGLKEAVDAVNALKYECDA